MEKEKSTFDKLTRVDVSKKTEKKGNLTYLSWAWAWAEAKRVCPTLIRTVYETEDQMNYFNDGKTAWVKVGVSIDGLEHIDYLPIMNTMGRPSSIPLEQITSFHVNTAIQRSTTKALALHGLGLSIYAGEDLNEVETPKTKNALTPDKSSLVKKPITIALKVGDDNWKKVLTYVANNKEQGLEKIAKTLAIKYKVTAPIKKELNNIIKNGQSK